MVNLRTLASGSVTLAFLCIWPSGCFPALAVEQPVRTAEINNAAELITALADPTIGEIVVMKDLTVLESDWSAYQSPLVLERNVTMRGFQDNPLAWPVLNLTFVRAKLRVGAGLYLNISHVIMVNWRRGPLFQAPGLDIIATGPAPSGANATIESAWPHISFRHMIFINRACLPPDLGYMVTYTTSRPELVPGKQIINHDLPQPNCNSKAERLVERCWPMAVEYIDLATFGMNFNGKDPEMAGYILVLLEVQSMCEVALSRECWDKLGSLGCFFSIFPATDPGLGLKLPPPAAEAPPPWGVGSDRSKVVGPAVGGAVAGVAVAVLLAGLLITRRLRGRARAAQCGGGGAATETLDDRSLPLSVRDDPEAATGRSPSPVDKLRKELSPGSCDKMATPDQKDSSYITARGATWRLVTGPSLVPVTPSTPCQPGVNLHVRLDAGSDEVRLLPVVIGKGSFGRVVEGLYGGQRVAVKLLNTGLLVGGPAAQIAGPQMRDPPSTLQLLSFHPVMAVPAAASASASASGGDLPVAPANLPPFAAALRDLQMSSFSANTHFATAGVALTLQSNASDGHRNQESDAVPCGGGGGCGATAAAAGASAGGGGGGGDSDGPPEPAGMGLEAGRAAGSSAPPEARNPLERTFLQEVEVLARLRHPNIVRLLGACLKPPELCLVMELMETSLERLLYGGGSLCQLQPLNKVLYIGLQIANALAYLHPTVMHRDLKPANILISGSASDTPVVKLADFGLSRLQTTVLVTAHVEVGTAPYMAPETLNAFNCVVTHHVDIYALGVLLWELLAGRRPWAGMSLVQVATAVSLREERLPLEDLPEERCPRRLRALMLACWDRVPERRPAASELVKELLLLQERVRQAGVSGTVHNTGAYSSVAASHFSGAPGDAPVAEVAAPLGPAVQLVATGDAPGR